MAAISKTKKIELLTKLIQKQQKSLPDPPERAVLAHLIYAALLENTSFEQADSAYTVLENYFIDWNEVRVSTVSELADTFPMLPDPQAAGERVRRTLQGVFEKTYMFDLEELRKKGKNLGQAVEFLNAIPACTRFMIDYATQVAFGGHVIPLDEASLRIFRLLDLAQVNKEGTRENVAGLERAISKKNGLAFSLQLHHFAAGFYNDPELAELRSILKTIDPEAENRSWTPPVLTIPKPVVKTPVKPELPPLAAIPFVAPDDDDFEEEHVGTEVEFIPDDMIYQHDSPTFSDKTNGKKNIPPSGEKKKTTKQEKTSAKKTSDSVPATPNPSQPLSQPSEMEKQSESVQEKIVKNEVAKNETDKKTTSKNNKPDTKNETKNEVKPDTKTVAKTDVKTDAEPVAKTEVKTDAEPVSKSDVKSDTKSVAKTDKKTTTKMEDKKDSSASSPSKQVADNNNADKSLSQSEENNTATVKSTIKQLSKKKPK
ncbi:MAG: MSCRAMM family adhesin SdrC [Planctomycetaceae bacterium]|jgi:endonuclease-3|nr:MSCRAMM family adhesin SdrC [Planctomycetaceae bacterium]